MNQITEFLLEIDRIANWIMGGDRSETISSRMGRNINSSIFAYYGCKLLEILMLDQRHCQEARDAQKNKENLKSNDHPIVFLIFFVGIAYALYYTVSQFVDKLG